MLNFLCPPLRLVAMFCGCSVLTAAGLANEPITVWLSDGRQVTGLADAQSDEQKLWLRREADRFELASGFPWDQLVTGQVGEKTMDLAALRDWVLVHKRPGRTVLEIGIRDDAERVSRIPSPATTEPERVQSLSIVATLAQWDGDAQTDGLRIFVAPLDARGQLVPIDGQIFFTLVVEIEKINGGQRGSLLPEFRQLDRGSFLVKLEHFADGPAAYNLPFSRQHPELDVNLGCQALVHARLGIPGHGVFEASDAQVSLREVSRFRDQLQLYSPHRYLPLEHGGPSRR